MILTLEAFGGTATPQTNAIANVRTVAAEYFVDFDLFDDRIDLVFSAVGQVAACVGGGPVLEVWANTSSGDASGSGTLLGTLTLPTTGTGGLFVGYDGRLDIDNPGGERYVTFTTRAGLLVDGTTPVALTFRGLLLGISAPDGDSCDVTTTPLIRLRNGAKKLADKVNDLSVDDDTWDEWVNDGVESLWACVSTYFADHFFAQVDFTLAGGVGGNSYDVRTIPAADFRRVRMLERYPDTGQRGRVRGFSFVEKDNGAGASPWASDWAPDVRGKIMGNTILLEPYERAGGPYRLYYVPKHPKLVLPCDALDAAVDQYAEYVKVFAAMKALGVEESDDHPQATRLLAIRQEIAETAAERDDGQPGGIADVEDQGGGFW